MAAEYSFGKLYELGLKNTFVVSSAANASRVNGLRGFDHVGFSVAPNYNYKWTFGAYAPTPSLSTSYAIEEYDGKARDNELLTLDVSYLKRISPAWFLTLGAGFQQSGTDVLPTTPSLQALVIFQTYSLL